MERESNMREKKTKTVVVMRYMSSAFVNMLIAFYTALFNHITLVTSFFFYHPW